MAMQMLRAGGMPILTDGIRAPDIDNPNGYYEFERAKTLREDASWVAQCPGKAVKVISALVPHLPVGWQYKVIFMTRDIDEVLSSQTSMLTHMGEEPSAPADRLAGKLTRHVVAVRSRLAKRADCEVLDITYADVLKAPSEQARNMNRFIGGHLDEARMAAAVEDPLYRHRRRALGLG